MSKQIPSSLTDAIEEEPERFISYLNLDKIFSSKNPYQEFMNQFEKAFGQKQGLNLWSYVLDKYKILNELYKSKEMQEFLPEEFKGSLKRSEVKEYFNKREIKITEKQKKLIIKRSKDKKNHTYSDRQARFILKRKNLSLKELVYEFNKNFDTNISYYGIRDKRLRLTGKK